ncbi:acyl-CoA synthetase [Dictyobacter sp. S3.2.2.5]|uniref:Acyl-CoA synthetase n=1 Tax=Dictyobacter halimunensis TaxID=3026934 RepID=A0ABQ6G5N5_9CHLR|nr:acyl-CoA synthetase [Dictyobacter sp. S3.2.2.5]
MLTVDLIRRGARQHAERRAVLFGDQMLTFRDVDDISNRFAHALINAGLDRGVKIALLVNNGLYSIPLDFACVKAGLNRVPLNSRLSLREHQHMLAETGAQLLVYGPDLAVRAGELKQQLPQLKLLSLGGGGSDDADLLDLARTADSTDPNLPIEPDDVLLTLYTSGTTGTLKAAQHTQRSYAAICANILANLLTVERDDVMLHAASLIHASGTFVLPFWLHGAASAVLARFEPNEFLASIARWKVTKINLVPTMLTMLFSLPGIEQVDVSSLNAVIYGASPMPLPVIQRGLQLWGPIFTQYYGQTEVPLCISVLRKEDHVGPGAEERLLSCGQPVVEAEVRLIDQEGRNVAVGEPGEIVVRAPFEMAGYFNAPDLNAETFLPAGWIRTRDIGRFDEQGYLYLVDRTSDMIVSGGYNVYPREVEDALLAHPAVQECAVVGAPDERWVETVVAFVVLKPGARATEEELISSARQRLASYKAPRSVRFIEQVPKSAVGKVLRRALRDPLWQGYKRSI